jgi:hypothetical protein
MVHFLCYEISMAGYNGAGMRESRIVPASLLGVFALFAARLIR